MDGSGDQVQHNHFAGYPDFSDIHAQEYVDSVAPRNGKRRYAATDRISAYELAAARVAPAYNMENVPVRSGGVELYRLDAYGDPRRTADPYSSEQLTTMRLKPTKIAAGSSRASTMLRESFGVNPSDLIPAGCEVTVLLMMMIMAVLMLAGTALAAITVREVVGLFRDAVRGPRYDMR